MEDTVIEQELIIMKTKRKKQICFLGPVDWLSLKVDRKTDRVLEKQ